MQWVENSLQQNMKIQDISYEQVFIKYEFAKNPSYLPSFYCHNEA